MLFLFCVVFSASSSRNKSAFSVVADAINSDYGGQEQCPGHLLSYEVSLHLGVTERFLPQLIACSQKLRDRG